MQSASAPGRRAVYQHCLDLMQKSFDLVDPATERVRVPFEGHASAGVLHERLAGRHSRRPS